MIDKAFNYLHVLWVGMQDESEASELVWSQFLMPSINCFEIF